MSDTSEKKELGQKIAEIVAEQAYKKYGDKIPVDLDPQEIADKVYPVVKREAKKHNHHTVRRMMKVVCMGMLGMAGVACATVVAIAVIEHKK